MHFLQDQEAESVCRMLNPCVVRFAMQTLFHEHQDTLTTAHVAAITMQLPAASHPNNPDLGSDVCIISEGLQVGNALAETAVYCLGWQVLVVGDSAPQASGHDCGCSALPHNKTLRVWFLLPTQAVALELMNRLEGQLHVLPARLLLGVSAALDSCSMPRTPTWRCAFLSAAASLVATHSSAAIAIGPAAASLGSATGPAASHSCSEAEVLSLARIICTMFTEEGSSEEALCSAALTERLVAVLRAAGGVASAAPAALAAQGVRERITGVRDAAEQLLHGEGALARIEAYPARVVLQVMDALVALGVQPSQQWLAAASAGLAVSARGPQQLVAGESLLARLGFDPTQQHMFVVQPSPIPAQASSSSCSDGLALASQQPSFDELAGPGSALAAAAAAATLSAAQQQQQQAERRASHSSASSSSGGSAGRSSSPSRSSSPGAGGNMGSSSGSVTAPSSALEGMAVLLSDAAASGMLPELKASVFSDLDGCDPALVLWSAEAFHQLGCPLTGRELARCVHLALDAIGASSNGGFAGPAAVSPLDVMILVQRCCSQGAPVPPGQLEVLLEYAMEQRRIMTPEQLAELLGAVAAVVARGAPDGASAGGTLCAVAEQDRRRAFGASWDDEDERGAGAVLDEDEEELLNGGASFGSSSSSSMECRAMDGALVSSVVSLLQPHLGSLGAGEAARLAGVLTTLRACGNAAARPQPAWLDAFCTAVQPQLPHLEPGQLRQVLALLATPTPARTWAPGAPFVQGCLAAATRLLKQAVPQVAKTGKLEGDARDIIPDTVAVLEHLVLDLACGGGQGAGQLAAGVAEHLAPALRTHAGALSASQAAGALRLLSVLRCRNEASRAAAAALAARLLDVPSPAAGATSKAASAGIRTLWPGRLAMVMWACGELGVKLSDTQLPVLLDTARAALPRMPPRALALLGRALVRLGVVPDQAFQVAYRDALLVAMPSSDAETLSLMCITLIHMGMVPDAQWRRAFIIESTFRMADVSGALCAHGLRLWLHRAGADPCPACVCLLKKRSKARTHQLIMRCIAFSRRLTARLSHALLTSWLSAVRPRPASGSRR